MTKRHLLTIALPILSMLLLTTGVVIGRELTAPATTTELSSAFSYQGNLTDPSGSVTDTCDIRFSLFDALENGNKIGSTLDRELDVVDGLFSVQLDFGGAAFDGGDRFLELHVRCPAGGGPFTELIPRQPMTPTPYAIYAFRAPWSGLIGVPDSFADGEDSDLLFGLSCEHNQGVKWNDIAQEWQCAFPEDEVDENQDFTESGAFIVPEGVKRLQVEVWGAGGGGGDHGGPSSLAGGGGGGGSGGYTLRRIDVTPGEELAVVIGDGGAPGLEGGDSSINRGESVLASATSGKPGQDGEAGTCSPLDPGAGGAPGEGGKGDTSDGNPGTPGGSGFKGGFPVTQCHQGASGPGGAAIEGTVVPLGSTGGTGGGVVFVPNFQSPPSSGGNGYVFIRW